MGFSMDHRSVRGGGGEERFRRRQHCRKTVGCPSPNLSQRYIYITPSQLLIIA